MFKKVKKFFLNKIIQINESHSILKNAHAHYKNSKVSIGSLHASLNAQKDKLKDISEVEFQVFSQFGDDGIIQYLINKLPIKYKTFIEFGVEDYKESNTRFLLVNNAWSGLVMDGSADNINKLKSEQIYSFYDIKAIQCFITRENINDLIRSAGFHSDVGILSIDIDGNDYWVWKAIDCIQPRIVICEYNSLFGFEDPITIPYQADFIRRVKTALNFYGTSLKAACNLAEEKGYCFIGCNSAGNNAYFIHQSLKQYCPVEEKTAEEGYKIAIFSEAWDDKKEPLRGKDKLKSIHGLEVINVDTNEKMPLNSEKIIQSLIKAEKLNGVHSC